MRAPSFLASKQHPSHSSTILSKNRDIHALTYQEMPQIELMMVSQWGDLYRYSMTPCCTTYYQ